MRASSHQAPRDFACAQPLSRKRYAYPPPQDGPPQASERLRSRGLPLARRRKVSIGAGRRPSFSLSTSKAHDQFHGSERCPSRKFAERSCEPTRVRHCPVRSAAPPDPHRRLGGARRRRAGRAGGAGRPRRNRPARVGRLDLRVDGCHQGAEARSERLRGARRRPQPDAHLSRAARGDDGDRRRDGISGRAIRAAFHRGLLHCLCRLAHRQLGAFCRGAAGRLQEVQHRLVAAPHQRGRLHRRADRRARDRQRISAFCRLARRSDPAGALHQGRNRASRRLPGGDDRRQAQLRLDDRAARRRRDYRGPT